MRGRRERSGFGQGVAEGKWGGRVAERSGGKEGTKIENADLRGERGVMRSCKFLS